MKKRNDKTKMLVKQINPIVRIGASALEIIAEVNNLSLQMEEHARHFLSDEELNHDYTDQELKQLARTHYDKAVVVITYLIAKKANEEIQNIFVRKGLTGRVRAYKDTLALRHTLQVLGYNYALRRLCKENIEMVKTFAAFINIMNTKIPELHEGFLEFTTDQNIPFRGVILRRTAFWKNLSELVDESFQTAIDKFEMGRLNRNILNYPMPVAIHKLDLRLHTINKEIEKIDNIIENIIKMTGENRKLEAAQLEKVLKDIYLPKEQKADIYDRMRAFEAHYNQQNLKDPQEKTTKSKVKRFFSNGLKPIQTKKKNDDLKELKETVLVYLNDRKAHLEPKGDETQKRYNAAKKNPFLILWDFIVRLFINVEAKKNKVKQVLIRKREEIKEKKKGRAKKRRNYREWREEVVNRRQAFSNPIHAASHDQVEPTQSSQATLAF